MEVVCGNRRSERAVPCGLGLALMLVPFLGPMTVMGQELKTVSASGEGISPDGARRAALRSAIEQAGAVEIASHSQVQNFELIRDTIYARAEGLVTDYRVIEEGAGAAGTYYCKIEARVNPSAIASTWAEVQNVLDLIGRPGIMVIIREFIDGVEDDSSILAAKLKERLIKIGFDVFSHEHFSEIQRREMKSAEQNRDASRLQMLAQEFGAQIFIVGSAHANSAGMEYPHGVALAMYNGDCTVDMFYTDTAKLIATEPLPNWRGGARGHNSISKQAGKTALANAGQELVNRLYESCMKYWSTEITAGREIQLEISGVDFKTASDIKKRIEALGPGVVESVNGPKLTAGVASYKIISRIGAQELAEHLIQGDWSSLIEITDLKLNRIQAQRVTVVK